MFTSKYLKTWQKRYLRIKKWCTFDVETTGLNPRKCTIFSYCICDEEGNVTVWRLDSKDPQDKEHVSAGWKYLKEFFADPSIGKIAHNFKFELHFLNAHNIFVHPDTVWVDTILMSRLLRNLAYKHGLDWLCHELINYEIDTPYGLFDSLEIDDLVKKQAKANNMRYDRVEHELMYWYQYADAERPMLLFQSWWPEFKNNGPFLRELIVEVLTASTSQRMESIGMRLHFNNTRKLITWMKEELNKTSKLVYDKYGEYLNLNGEKDVNRILFEILDLPKLKFSETTGIPTTDKDVLFALQEKYPKLKVLQWINKTRSYTNGSSILQSYIDLSEKGLIHANVNSCQARTRRQSSSKPNMQNVSKSKGMKKPFPVPARKCFRCKPGFVNYFVDYAAIELRLIIELANSITMMDIMNRGESPHDFACKIFFGDKYINKEESKEIYDTGKNGHFCLGYGGNVTKFALVTGLPLEIAKIAVSNYQEAVPEIAYLCRNIGNTVRDTGYVITPFGSKICVPIKKGYMGLNYLIQNTAAMILKRAEINLDHYFKTVWSDDIHLTMVIHDETIIEIPKCKLKYLDEIRYTASELMIDMPEIKVGLGVEWSASPALWSIKNGLPPVIATPKILEHYENSLKRMLLAA